VANLDRKESTFWHKVILNETGKHVHEDLTHENI